jgi:hypothetical protein
MEECSVVGLKLINQLIERTLELSLATSTGRLANIIKAKLAVFKENLCPFV